MKMVKSLLLGSAAGVVAVAGAQAADLPVKAKPVQYVKICTLYGDGFYYIPGSDTCIRFSGYIRADYNYNGRARRIFGVAPTARRTAPSATTRPGIVRNFGRRYADADCLRHAADVYERQHGEREDAESVQATRAFIQWGGFTFGRTASFIDHEGSLGDSGLRSLYTGLDRRHHRRQRHQPDRLHVAARQRHHPERRCRRRRVKSIANLTRDGGHASAARSDQLRARQQSHPDPVGFVARQPGLGPRQRGGDRQPERGHLLHRRAAACGVCAQNRHHAVRLSGRQVGLCGRSPASRSSSTSLSPGSRIGGYFNYGVRARPVSRANSQTSPGLYRLRQPDRFRCP